MKRRGGVRPSGAETGAPRGSLVTWRGGLKGERVRAAAEGRGHTMQEHDPRLKSRDLGWQRRAQEANFRQGRKTVSTLLGPLLWEDCSGGSEAEERSPGGAVTTGSKQELTQAHPLQLGGSGWKKKSL